MKAKLLAILIPTFNRSGNLMINLAMLEETLAKLECYKDVKIIISDNCSADETSYRVNQFIEKSKIDIEFYKQSFNIGLEKNAVFCLSKSDAEYSMFLGDDDYLDDHYIELILNYLNQKNVTCIIPNYYNIDSDFKKIGNTRDVIGDDRIFSIDDNKLELMFKAHQLSGLTIKTESTLKSYIDKGGSNIYLFMYFAAFNIKRGVTIHITKFPVQVTDTNKKDWNYGKDGLITEVLQNVKLIVGSDTGRYELEKYFIMHNKWRVLGNLGHPHKFIKHILSSANITPKGKKYIVNVFINGYLMYVPRKIKNTITKYYKTKVEI